MYSMRLQEKKAVAADVPKAHQSGEYSGQIRLARLAETRY